MPVLQFVCFATWLRDAAWPLCSAFALRHACFQNAAEPRGDIDRTKEPQQQPRSMQWGSYGAFRRGVGARPYHQAGTLTRKTYSYDIHRDIDE